VETTNSCIILDGISLERVHFEERDGEAEQVMM
jgi:hypothetical protein